MLRKVQDLLRLNDLGDAEIAVYVALLKLRRATIPQLRAKTNLPNITVYRALGRLEEQEMVSALKINAKQKAYVPLTLDVLIDRVAQRQRKLRRMEIALRGLDRLLPYMGDAEEDAPEVEVREGVEAVKETYLGLPEEIEGSYRNIGDPTCFWKSLKLSYEAPEERHFINRRLERRIHASGISAHSPAMEAIARNNTREMRSTRFVDSIPLKKDMVMVMEDKIAHFVADEDNPRVILMRNPELVASQKAHFDLLWNS